MGIEEHLPGVSYWPPSKRVAGYARAHLVWPAWFCRLHNRLAQYPHATAWR
jgi:hypothetical protein